MGHPFLRRNIWPLSSEEEFSPLFLQFLDCTWQVIKYTSELQSVNIGPSDLKLVGVCIKCLYMFNILSEKSSSQYKNLMLYNILFAHS